MRAIARAVGVAIALSVLGCLPLPGAPAASQTVLIESAATVSARIRIGPFRAGAADVKETEMLEEATLAAKGRQSFTLPAGRYNIEAVAVTAKAETATSNFTLAADRPVGLQLHEQLTEVLERTPASASPAPLRQLSWIEQ